MQSEKELYRKQIKEKLQSIPHSTWSELSETIFQQTVQSSLWQNAQHIAIYYSVGKEVFTHPLIEKGWQEGKSIYLPKCQPKQKKLVFYRLDSWEQLTDEFYGIKEPNSQMCMPMMEEELALIIVPGLCYDYKGYRIGYGGGYYDRYLAQLDESIPRISLAFQLQVFDKMLPREETDQPVDLLITEEQLIQVNKKYEE